MRKGIRYEPLGDRFPHDRTRSPSAAPFRSTWGHTEELLHREASKVGNPAVWTWAEVVIDVEADHREIRADRSCLLASAKPGNAVVVHVPHADLSFPCDTFDRWRDNVRAVALTMEKLRAIDRYGVATTGQQYTGWKALPEQSIVPSASDPIIVLSDVLEWPLDKVNENLDEAVRLARMRSQNRSDQLSVEACDPQEVTTPNV